MDKRKASKVSSSLQCHAAQPLPYVSVSNKLFKVEQSFSPQATACEICEDHQKEKRPLLGSQDWSYQAGKGLHCIYVWFARMSLDRKNCVCGPFEGCKRVRK